MPSKFKFHTASFFFLSLVLYIFIIFIIFIRLNIHTQMAKNFSDDKDAFMDVVMIEREISEVLKTPKQDEKIIKEQKPKPEVKPEPKPQENKDLMPPNKEQEIIKEPAPNLKDLFNDIDASKLKNDPIVQKPKKNSANSKPSTQASDIIKNLQIDSVSKTQKTQTIGVYKPLYADIQRQITRKWLSYKAGSNNIAKVSVMIDSNGNFSYEIVELSYNEEFNDKVRECLEKLTQEKFPYSKEKSLIFDITLEDKLE